MSFSVAGDVGLGATRLMFNLIKLPFKSYVPVLQLCLGQIGILIWEVVANKPPANRVPATLFEYMLYFGNPALFFISLIVHFFSFKRTQNRLIHAFYIVKFLSAASMTAFFGVTTSIFLATEEAKAMVQTNFILLILASICAFAESVSALVFVGLEIYIIRAITKAAAYQQIQ